MKIKFSLLFIAFLVALSCSKDESTNSTPKPLQPSTSDSVSLNLPENTLRISEDSILVFDRYLISDYFATDDDSLSFRNQYIFFASNDLDLEVDFISSENQRIVNGVYTVNMNGSWKETFTITDGSIGLNDFWVGNITVKDNDLIFDIHLEEFGFKLEGALNLEGLSNLTY